MSQCQSEAPTGAPAVSKLLEPIVVVIQTGSVVAMRAALARLSAALVLAEHVVDNAHGYPPAEVVAGVREVFGAAFAAALPMH